MQLLGYIVRETEAAIAFVGAADRDTVGVKPLWLPRKKVLDIQEQDAVGRTIRTAQDGERIGTPCAVTVEIEFLKKIGIVK